MFDSSLGGVGGSKAASQMVGNIATESLVALFEGMGQQTGIDNDVLLRDAGATLTDMCVAAGESPPPSGMLREKLGISR